MLSDEIEAATGPTEEWHAVAGDPIDDPPMGDHLAFAVRDVQKRLDGGWARCDSLPSDPKEAKKLQGAIWLTSGCSDGYEIAIHTDVPTSAVRRFLATCSSHVDVDGLYPGYLAVRTLPSAGVLAQISASELVTQVDVHCQARMQIE